MTLSSEVANLNSDFDDPNNLEMPSYDELSHILNDLHNDMTSLCVKITFSS